MEEIKVKQEEVFPAHIKLAKKNNFSVIISHRSGDTDEDFLADFAVGVGADFVKFGAPGRGERVAKYNRLLFIQEYLESLHPSQ